METVKPTEKDSDIFSSIQTSEVFASNSLSKQSSSCSINGSKTSNNVIDNENNNPHVDVADAALNASFSKLNVGEELQAEENECSQPFSCHEKFFRQQSQSSDSSVHSLHSSPTRTDHFNRIKFHGGAKKVIYAVNKNGCSIPVEVLHSKNDGNLTAPTEPSSTSSQNSESTDKSSAHRFSNSRRNPNGQSNDIIHILPETLVNGAVNVATSALSRAKAVISNLTTIPIGVSK